MSFTPLRNSLPVIMQDKSIISAILYRRSPLVITINLHVILYTRPKQENGTQAPNAHPYKISKIFTSFWGKTSDILIFRGRATRGGAGRVTQ